MNTNTFNALQSMISKLFKNAIKIVQEVSNETDNIYTFDDDALYEMAFFINHLRSIKRDFDLAEETNSIEHFKPNLEFLNGNCSEDQVAGWLGEEYASELSNIWYLITDNELSNEEVQNSSRQEPAQ